MTTCQKCKKLEDEIVRLRKALDQIKVRSYELGVK